MFHKYNYHLRQKAKVDYKSNPAKKIILINRALTDCLVVGY
jgi:hypothetical protein